MRLINGTSVHRVAVEGITYWHVKLDGHDILLADGLPPESYLDWGGRPFFEEGADHRLANPDFVVPGVAGRCRPVALDGTVVEAEGAASMRYLQFGWHVQRPGPGPRMHSRSSAASRSTAAHHASRLGASTTARISTSATLWASGAKAS